MNLLLVQIANAVVKSDKYPECKEHYSRIKAHRGHKKAIIAICRMFLTDIWNILSKGEPYSAEGYLSDIPAEYTKVLTTQQALNLLKPRGYAIKDNSLLIKPDIILQKTSLEQIVRQLGTTNLAIRIVLEINLTRIHRENFVVDFFLLIQFVLHWNRVSKRYSVVYMAVQVFSVSNQNYDGLQYIELVIPLCRLLVQGWSCHLSLQY